MVLPGLRPLAEGCEATRDIGLAPRPGFRRSWRLAVVAVSLRGVQSAVAPAPAPDVAPPSLTLHGSSAVTFRVGDVWSDPGAECIDTLVGIAGRIRTPLRVRASGAPPDGVLQAAATYSVKYECTDSAGNRASPATRIVQVVAAARHWRLMPVGVVGAPSAKWFVRGVRFFSDVFCTRGVEVIPRRDGQRWPTGSAFSSPSGTTARADTAFAIWRKAGKTPTDLGPGWSADRDCSDAVPGRECYVGFSFEQPVVINCVKLDQGTDPGSYASGLRLQWRRESAPVPSGSSGYSDFIVKRSLGSGAAQLRRPCPAECGSCNSPGHVSHSCAAYSPSLTAMGFQQR